MIEDGESGFLVPMRDSEAIAERIGDLLTDTEYRENMGMVAREYVHGTHSWKWLVDELESVYDRIQ